MMPTHIVAVGGLVKDSSGRVLIAKSKRHGNWEFLGGQVEVGENLEEALIREIKEESGVTSRVIRLAGVYSNVKYYTDDRGVFIPTKVMLDFVCEYLDGTPADSDETESVMWVPAQRARELIVNPTLKMRLENMLNCDGAVKYCAYETRPFVEHFTRLF